MKKGIKKSVAFFLGACMLTSVVLPGMQVAEVSAAEVDLSKGLAGYWNFDSTSMDNLATGSSCKAAMVGNGVKQVADSGVSGGAAYFSKEAGSSITISNALNTSADDFTLAAWVKYDKDAFSGATDNMNLFQQTGDGKTILYLQSSLTYGTYLTGSDSYCEKTTELDSWNHVAFTSNHSTKKVQFYLNGELVNENVLSGNFTNATTDILVGIHKGLEAKGAIKGYVDELRFYKTVVDADMVKEMYSQYAAVQGFASLQRLVDKAKTLKGATDEAAVKKLEDTIKAAEDFISAGEINLEEMQKHCSALEAAMKEYNAAVSLTISVDTDNVLREIADNMFGINHRYANDGYGSYNAKEQKIEEQFNEYVKEANFGSVRYPGGAVANLFDWKRSIGPVNERKKTIHGLPDGNVPITPNFGVDEAMKWIYDELDSDAIWVYGMGQGSASDAADLFEYLNAPNDGSNPNGGVDWAAKRAENGHEEPYGVTNFEIGNEIGYWGQTYWIDGRASGRSKNDAYIDGGTMTFGTNTNTVQEEDWRTSAAISNGSAGQVRYVKYVPVTEGTASVYVGGTKWDIVDSLEGKGKTNVCTFDYKTGRITFGDGTNGNIPASGSSITAGYTTEQDGFVNYYKELKKIAKELDMEVHVYSSVFDAEFTTLMKQKGYNEYYDGIVIHPYSDSNSDSIIPASDPQFYEKILGRSLQYNITRVQALVDRMEAAAPGMHKVPVLSEFGIYNYNSKFVRSIGHAVYIANEMIDYINLGTPYINKHCLVDYPYGSDSLGPGAQCVIQTIVNDDGSVSFVSTPSAKMFSIFNGMTGNKEVSQEITGNFTYYTYMNYDVPTVKVLSTTDDEGNTFVTIVNNRKDDETQVAVSVDDRDLTGVEAEVWYLTSENADDENTLNDPDLVDVEKTTTISSGRNLNYTLAPHSITSIKIPAQEGKPSEVDKTLLLEKFNECKELKETDYTEESFGVFKAALDEAEAVLNKADVAQEEVDSALEALWAAKDALKKVQESPVAGRNELDALVKKYEAEKLSGADYKEDTWKVYEQALSEAKEVLVDETASQEEISGAYTALKDAYNGLILSCLPFEDVTSGQGDNPGDWFYNTVADVYRKGLMTGKTETIFAPTENLARAQFAVILWRMEGEPQVDYKEEFPDVPAGQFYTDAVLWASGKGIVTGYTSTGTFGPGDDITREQMAVMMYRYAKAKEYDTTKTQELTDFPDANKVSGFAQEAMKWCVAEKIISGDKGNLNPQGSTNRAECATIISRFVNIYK